MKRLGSFIAAAVFATALAGLDARQELDALGKKAQAAFAKEDAAYLTSLLADNFVWKRKGRPNENKAQASANLKQFFAMANGIRVNWVTKSFSAKGNKAVILTDETMTCKMTTPDKKTHTMKSMGSIRETWVKGAKGWRATMFEDMGDEKLWMDGKPFDPKKMGGG